MKSKERQKPQDLCPSSHRSQAAATGRNFSFVLKEGLSALNSSSVLKKVLSDFNSFFVLRKVLSALNSSLGFKQVLSALNSSFVLREVLSALNSSLVLMEAWGLNSYTPLCLTRLAVAPPHSSPSIDNQTNLKYAVNNTR